jgi:RNA polymerase sigma-70 factor (family 1)
LLTAPLINELELMKALREGSADAFTKIYRHYCQPVYYTILSLVKDPMTTEELVQEIFTKIWQRHDQIQIQNNFGGYLYHAAKNTTHDFFRRLKREQALYNRIKNIVTEEYFHVEEALLEKENADLLQQAIKNLTPQRRRAFELVKVEGHSYQHASEKMGITISTLKDHMHHARESVREFLSRHPETILSISLFVLIKQV